MLSPFHTVSMQHLPDPWPSSKPRNDNKASSLHHAVEDTTGYNTTPLAPTLAYVYPHLAATSLLLNPSGAITSASQASFVEAKVIPGVPH